MDADLGLWDPELTRTVTAAGMHHAVDYTPYEGMTLTGWPVTTIVRGQVVMESGSRQVEPGFGQFQPRGNLSVDDAAWRISDAVQSAHIAELSPPPD